MVTLRRVLVAGALLLLLGACRAIAGLHDLQYVASSGGGDDAGSAADVVAEGDAAPACTLPALGDAAVRVGDFVPSTDRYAVCLHRTDGTTSLDDLPLPGAAGPGCPASIGFADVLAPIGLPSGTYDVSVAAPGAGCGSPAATAHGVVLSGGTSTAVYLLQGAAQTIELTPFPETIAQGQNSSLRFLNAVAGGSPLDFGLTTAPTMPTTLLSAYFTQVAYGHTGAPWVGAPSAIDANGYLSVDFISASLPYGVAPSGQKAVSRLINQNLTTSHGYTVFAAGSSTDARFPTELVMCDEASLRGAFTSCGEIVDVRTAAYDADLTGTFSPLQPSRQQAALDAMAQLDADVQCVVDVFPSALRDALVAEARPRYPYSVRFKDTPDTPVDDPTDQNGNIPAPPTSPPCTPSDAALQSFLTCTVASCSTSPNDTSGTLIVSGATDCLSNNCYSPTAALVYNEPSCWSCALAEMESGASWSKLQSDCEQNVKAGLSFDGDVGTVILSRLPVISSDQFVLPATQWRTAVSHAVLAAGGGTPFDFYCTALDVAYTGATHPYVGQYGGGAPNSDAQWAAEQLLEAQKLVAYVQRTSGQLGRRAVVAGNFSAGGSWPGQSISGVSEATTFATLNTFPLAMTPGYVPSCTDCASNPITTPPGTPAGSANTWTVFSLLVNVATTDVSSSGVVLDQPVVSYQPPDGGAPYALPPSRFYGYAATVRVRP